MRPFDAIAHSSPPSSRSPRPTLARDAHRHRSLFSEPVRRALLVVLVGVVALVGVVGCSGEPAPTPSDPQLAEGQEIFRRNCAACHGASGGGGAAPALAGVVSDRFPDPADQVALIANGVPGTNMVAFAGRLTPEEIEAVVAYTRESL